MIRYLLPINPFNRANTKLDVGMIRPKNAAISVETATITKESAKVNAISLRATGFAVQ